MIHNRRCAGSPVNCMTMSGACRLFVPMAMWNRACWRKMSPFLIRPPYFLFRIIISFACCIPGAFPWSLSVFRPWMVQLWSRTAVRYGVSFAPTIICLPPRRRAAGWNMCCLPFWMLTRDPPPKTRIVFTTRFLKNLPNRPSVPAPCSNVLISKCSAPRTRRRIPLTGTRLSAHPRLRDGSFPPSGPTG